MGLGTRKPGVSEVSMIVKPGVLTHKDFKDRRAALRGSRCGQCAETFFPYRGVCPRCKTADTMTEVALSRVGTVRSCTRVVRTPPHYCKSYWLGKIDLPEGVRLLSQIAARPANDVHTGMQVELVIGPMFKAPDGSDIWGYQFQRIPTAPDRIREG